MFVYSLKIWGFSWCISGLLWPFDHISSVTLWVFWGVYSHVSLSLSLQVYSRQFLHEIRPHAFPNQHELPPQCPPPKVASISRSTDIWDQQILTGTLDFKPLTLDRWTIFMFWLGEESSVCLTNCVELIYEYAVFCCLLQPEKKKM